MASQFTRNQKRWQFWIDRGGTFTDIVAQNPHGSTVVHKLLSENPERYLDAPIQGIRELMGLTAEEPIPAEQIAVIKMGTTVATNALLERKGDRTFLITTKGFRDGLRIGYQNRPDIFAREIVLPEMLYERVVEIEERISAKGEALQPITAEIEQQILADLQAAYDSGIRACAIALLHSYRYPTHEQKVAQLTTQIGFTQVSISHQTSPLIKWVSRADTTVVDAYLSPLLRRYVDRIEQAFTSSTSYQAERGLSGVTDQLSPQILFMQSNGGLTPAKFFQGKDSILSGPAGGIVGAVQTSIAAGFDKIITFDMGGTSTDVAHFNAKGNKSRTTANYERVFETEVAGVRLRSPMMAIHTVAAGGGSILNFDGARYQVGPDSAGADPGPTCYRKNGPLTVTDCNVMLGKIQPDFFPSVFGPNGDQPLDRAAVVSKFSALIKEIEAVSKIKQTPEQAAAGFLRIAIDNMANAIKKVSVQKGYDVGGYTLCCFGGAGGQHVCQLAAALGMRTVLIHPYAGVLSAYGMGLADRNVIKEASIEMEIGEIADLEQQLDRLEEQAIATLKEQGDRDIHSLEISRQCHLRYAGTDSTLAVDFASTDSMAKQFEQSYQQQYGITLPGKQLVIATITVEAIGKTKPAAATELLTAVVLAAPESTVPLFSNNQWLDAPVFRRGSLSLGQKVTGPALILEGTGTNVIEPGWEAEVRDGGNLVLVHIDKTSSTEYETVGTAPDPVRLEIFNNLFQAIAQQMGVTLQNTSSSVNIKERLDFSCAIFDANGELVANAPHIPVHLGSMGESVKALIKDCPQPFQPGDMYVSNNPYNGGTHLPDVTAIAPVFARRLSAAVGVPPSLRVALFFVASRGHHADIGGITPGSVPPHSTHLDQEGILLDNFHLVKNNALQVAELEQQLTNSPLPVRNFQQNLADLQAQVAANNKGIQELQNTVQQFGLETVQAYMKHVQNNAEQAVRKVISVLHSQHGSAPLTCTVPMDCGATIKVAIALNPTDNSAIIDFTGTSAQQPNNFNAPLAVCKAAVLYVFRTLVDIPIPLNAGCLKPLDIKVPQGSLLNPTYPAAVVAGNVETSQAITDALYGALGILAASQGTMNNFTFGNDQYQYYETICGGSGAGINFDSTGFAGTDAVQTHMTNSRLTDPEILETRFPVLLKEFSIRAGSGGNGQYPGGNGVTRHLQFRQPMTANLLSGRRTTVPFGLAGGTAGQSGNATIRRKDQTQVDLPATATVEMQPDDEIIIQTPGGGGYGR
ncbi:MAG: hydantoinase B/oxoprolinase family protein [Cyanobacteria bacterium P01_D01_bin.1]